MWSYHLKISWLSLKKTPFLSLLMVLAISVGIAACLTTMTCYNALNNNPMQHKNDRIFAVQLDSWEENQPYRNRNQMPLQLTYKDASAILESGIPSKTVVMYKVGTTLQDIDRKEPPTSHATRLVTRDFFGMFDVTFIFGSPWSVQAEQDMEHILIISEDINNRIFNGKNSTGETVLVDGEAFTIAGVVSSGWQLIPQLYDLNQNKLDNAAGIYMPFTHVTEKEYTSWGSSESWRVESLNNRQDLLDSEIVWLQTWVELSNQEEFSKFSQFITQHIENEKTQGRFARPTKFALNSPSTWLTLNEVLSNEDRLLVFVSVAFLGVCLINSIVLLLAKFLQKSGETGIRRALGASRKDIFSQHIIESLFIGVAGGLVGLLLSFLGLASIRHIYPTYENVAVMSYFTLFLSVTLALIASVLSGIIPAWKISNTQPAYHLKAQ